MKTNIGTIDRVVRIAAGLGLLSLAFVGPHTPWGYLGIVLVGTALIGYCPAYTLLGVRTCATRDPGTPAGSST